MEEPKTARRIGPVTLAELTAGLVWPVLLRSVSIAVHPPRLMLGFATVICLAIVSGVFDLARGADSSLAQTMFVAVEQGVLDYSNGIVTFQWISAVNSLVHAVYQIPLETFFDHPWASALLILLLLPVWATGGGAISRMAAVDLAADLNMSIREALAFALPRVLSFTFSLALPLIFMLVIAGAIKFSGAVLLGLPGLDILGAVLYALLLFAGFVLVLLAIGFAAGQSLLVPAVATEGTDALDAVQRAYSYVLGRPGRLVIYASIVLLLGAVSYVIAEWAVAAVIDWTHALATSELRDTRIDNLAPADADPSIAGRILLFWETLAALILPAFAVSYYFSASTALYLLLRRVNDEQDIREVWMPGMVGGTMALRETPGASAPLGSPANPDPNSDPAQPPPQDQGE